MHTRRHNRGTTLIEAVVAIVVLGIAIPPLVTLFTEVASHSADHTYQGVAMSYAEGLMEEIVSKAYEDPEGSSATSFVAAADSSSATETTSHTVTIPSHSSGDLLVLAFTQTAGATSPATATSTPSGWTQIRNLEAGDASAVRLTVFTKVGNGSESSVAVTTSAATGFGGTCCAYSGVSGVVDISGEAQQETGTDMSAPTVTTTEASTRVIWCFAFDDDLASQTDVVSDAGFQGTLRGYEEQALPGNGFACGVSDASLASAGASGACDFSTNGDSDAGCAITLALKATDPSASYGPEEGSRADYDDVDDFDGLSNSPPERIDGTALSEYGGFTRSVTVENVTAADPDPVTPEADGSTEFKRIRVTVAWTGAGAGEVTLSTLRTLLSGSVGSSGPLDEAAAEATAVRTLDKMFTLDLVSISADDVEIESFDLSCDVASSKVRTLKLANTTIWSVGGGVDLPTGVTALNSGSAGARTVSAGASPTLLLEFMDNQSGSKEYTLVLAFTDGSSATMTFTISW